ncbi:MAG: NnrS family protein [Candidatus Omnitrophica bacterium]|nr:NnrS family protein [Candidatus Omnitrophota bacterium]
MISAFVRSSLKQVQAAVLREPYRIFFPAGMLFGLIGVGHWLFYGIGLLPAYSIYFHSYLQMHVYLGCFAAGFLFTSIPRFSGAPHATLAEVVLMSFILISIALFLGFGIWMGAGLSYIAFLLAIGRFVAVRFHKELAAREPTEFVWIPLGIFHGVVGTLIYLAARLRWTPVWMFEVGEEMSELGFIICVVLGIGGFLVPRLMGRQKLLVKPFEGHSLEFAKRIRRQRMILHITAGILLFISFWLEGLDLKVQSFALRAVIITAELVWTGSLPFPPRAEGAHAKFLWLSMWMIVIGSWALVLFPEQEKTMLHFIFVGGFSLMIFSVSTVVVLSHAGQAHRLQHGIWALRIIIFCVASALGFRIAAPYFPERFFSLLAHGAVFWFVAGIAWLLFALPKITRVPHP